VIQLEVLTYNEFLSTTTKEINHDANLDKVVLDIIQHVRQKGDQAIFNYTEKFDQISHKSLLQILD